MRARLGFALALAAGLSACATAGSRPVSTDDPYPSTYRAYPGVPTALVGATVYDGAGGRIDGGTVLIAGGKVVALGRELALPLTRIGAIHGGDARLEVRDAQGRPVAHRGGYDHFGGR